MTATKNTELEEKFIKDARILALELIKLYSLKFDQEVESLSDPLLRWLDFRLRYISPIPRKVIFSKNFPKKSIPAETVSALEKLVSVIEKGEDVNPYQGKGLTLFHDTGGAKSGTRTDLLFADWGIIHFHLSNAPLLNNENYSQRSDYLAFCLIDTHSVRFIDVLKHPKRDGFANPALIASIFESWPEYMDALQLRGIEHPVYHTQAEIDTLRRNGFQPIINFNGRPYIGPGMGITSASTPAMVTLAYHKIIDEIKILASEVSNPKGQFRTSEINNLEENPCFSIFADDDGLSVYEETTKHAFIFPKPTDGSSKRYLESIHDLLLPEWARTKLKK